MSTAEQVLSLFILMLAGLALFKTRMLSQQGLAGLNKVLVNLALPCMTFMKLQTDASPQLVADLASIFVYSLLVMLLSCLAGCLIFKKQSDARKAVFVSLTTFSNAGFMGYPVIAAALGADAVIYAVAYVTAFNFLLWTLGTWIYQKGQPFKLSTLLNPSLLAVILGMVFFLTGWRVPHFLGSAMNYLGDTTTPLSMLIVGARLASLNRDSLKDPALLLAALLRLVILPAALLGILHLIPCAPMVRVILFLCCAMPSGAMCAVQAELYQGDSPLASRGVALSTALSMFSIPLMLLLI